MNVFARKRAEVETERYVAISLAAEFNGLAKRLAELDRDSTLEDTVPIWRCVLDRASRIYYQPCS